MDDKNLTDAEKIEKIERALNEKDNEIAQLKATNETLQKKINSLKVDGLVRQVEPVSQPVEEDIQFDFDL